MSRPTTRAGAAEVGSQVRAPRPRIVTIPVRVVRVRVTGPGTPVAGTVSIPAALAAVFPAQVEEGQKGGSDGAQAPPLGTAARVSFLLVAAAAGGGGPAAEPSGVVIATAAVVAFLDDVDALPAVVVALAAAAEQAPEAADDAAEAEEHEEADAGQRADDDTGDGAAAEASTGGSAVAVVGTAGNGGGCAGRGFCGGSGAVAGSCGASHAEGRRVPSSDGLTVRGDCRDPAASSIFIIQALTPRSAILARLAADWTARDPSRLLGHAVFLGRTCRFGVRLGNSAGEGVCFGPCGGGDGPVASSSQL